MLWTIFVLFMFAWMLGLVLQFRLGAIPLMTLLAIVLAFVQMMRRSSFHLQKAGGRIHGIKR